MATKLMLLKIRRTRTSTLPSSLGGLVGLGQQKDLMAVSAKLSALLSAQNSSSHGRLISCGSDAPLDEVAGTHQPRMQGAMEFLLLRQNPRSLLSVLLLFYFHFFLLPYQPL